MSFINQKRKDLLRQQKKNNIKRRKGILVEINDIKSINFNMTPELECDDKNNFEKYYEPNKTSSNEKLKKDLNNFFSMDIEDFDSLIE